jgi:hypothetical protein
MKSKIAKEVLWFIVALAFAFPLAFGFLWMLDITASGNYPSEEEKDFVVELYLIGCILSFLGIYLMRIIAMLIRTAVAGK